MHRAKGARAGRALSMAMMRTMDSVRRGTRARRLDAAAARAANGSNGHAPDPPGPSTEVDHTAFPDRATRLALDGGKASAKFRALIDQGGPIVADGAMGTMLFANGLQFGDPPEVWNLAHPDVIRRIQRGYLEAGSQIVLTNTFGGNRARLRLSGHGDRVDELNRTAAILLRAEVDAAGGTALVAGDIGPTGEIVEPLGTLAYDDAVEIFREQAASLVAGGVDLIWIETMSDLYEIKAAIEGVRQGRSGHRARDHDDLRHPRPHDDGRLAGAGGRGARRLGCRRGRRQLRERAGRAHPRHRRRCAPRRPTSSSWPSRTPGCPSSSTCARSIARIPRRWPARSSRCARRARRSSAAAAGARRTTCARSRRAVAAHG